MPGTTDLLIDHHEELDDDEYDEREERELDPLLATASPSRLISTLEAVKFTKYITENCCDRFGNLLKH